MNCCVCCGTSLPNNQGSKTCSVCYGDPDHGSDGILRQQMDAQRDDDWLDRQERHEWEEKSLTWQAMEAFVRREEDEAWFKSYEDFEREGDT